MSQLFLILFSFSISAQYGGGIGSNYGGGVSSRSSVTYDQAIDMLNEAAKQLAPKSQRDTCDGAPNNFNCTLASACHELYKNADNKDLYVSSDGGRVPNKVMYEMALTLDVCAANQTKPGQTTEPDFIQTHEDLVSEAIARGESDIFLATQQLYQEQLYNASFNNYGNGLLPEITLESLRETSKKAQARFGIEKPLGDAVLKKWLAVLNPSFGEVEKDPSLRSYFYYDNPFLYPADSLGYDVNVTEAQKKAYERTYQNGISKGLETAEDTRNAMIQLMLKKKQKVTATYGRNSRTTKQQHQHIDAIIARIKTVKISNYQPGQHPPGTCDHPNAFYRSTNHEVLLCPQLFGLPQMAIFEVTAHEIAHSFDSCRISYDLVQSKQPKTSIPPTSYPGSLISVNPDSFDSSPSTYRLTRAWNRDKKRLISAGQSIDDSPLHTELKCLESESFVGKSSNYSIKKDVHGAIRALRDERLAEGFSQDSEVIQALNDALADIDDQWINERKHCQIGDLTSRTAESLSDLVATQAVVEHVENKVPAEKRKTAYFESMAFSLQSSCIAYLPDAYTAVELTAARLGCDGNLNASPKEVRYNTETIADFALALEKDSHSRTPDRFENIFFAHPKARAAFNCPRHYDKLKSPLCHP